MATKTKIFFRIALLSGVGYVIYRNKDRIIGKLNKLSRMNSTDEVVDDLGMTANKALDGALGMVDEAIEYVTTFGEGEEAEPLNKTFLKEIEQEMSGIPLNYATQLKSMADNLVIDITYWNNPNWNYQGEYKQKGKMPIESFRKWYNYLRLQKDEDFNKVANMANIMLKYNYPYKMEVDTIKNNKLPNLSYYMSNPPVKFTRLNDLDWGSQNKMNYNVTPQELFKEINNKLKL